NSYTFYNIQPGNYKVKIFHKNNEEIVSKSSENIKIRNVSSTTSTSTKFVIDEPNYDLLWISTLLNLSHEINYYIDESKEGNLFNNLKPISYQSAKDNEYKILT